jgi:hypothetical protein
LRRGRWPVKLCAVTGAETGPPAQLLLYGFGPGAEFEGQLVGALERIESGGALRILDALFVANDAETGEIVAVDLHGGGAGGAVAALVGFRLDPAERQRASEQVLATPAGDTLRELAAALQPGAAMAAVLVEHVWARSLDDAVSRIGGAQLANEPVAATELAELSSNLLAAARRSSA